MNCVFANLMREQEEYKLERSTVQTMWKLIVKARGADVAAEL